MWTRLSGMRTARLHSLMRAAREDRDPRDGGEWLFGDYDHVRIPGSASARRDVRDISGLLKDLPPGAVREAPCRPLSSASPKKGKSRARTVHLACDETSFTLHATDLEGAIRVPFREPDAPLLYECPVSPISEKLEHVANGVLDGLISPFAICEPAIEFGEWVRVTSTSQTTYFAQVDKSFDSCPYCQ